LLGHRRRQLIVRAAVDGVIDPTTVDLRDPHWYIQLNWRLDELERKERIEILRLLHERSAARLNRAVHINLDSFNNLAKQEQKAFRELMAEYIGDDGADAEQRVYDEARAAWIKAYGDPNDPAVRARIDTVVERLKPQPRKKQSRR
jgi:hypothetical protein